MKKKYILDTNVLIESEKSIEKLINGNENEIFIPKTVLNELNGLKKDNKLRERVIKAINEILLHEKNITIIDYSSKPNNDDMILKDILRTSLKDDENTIFVTNDKLLTLKAIKNGIKTQEYKDSIPFKSESEIYTGIVEENEEKINNCFYWKEGKIFHYFDKKEKIIDYEHEIWGIKPKNIYQNMAFELLNNPKIDLVSIQSKAGTGKAQPLYSKILTPNGWKTMGNLNIGDDIINSMGNKTSITNIYPQGKKDIYEVIFNDGTKTRCCDEHLWGVYYENQGNIQIKQLKDIKNDLYNDKRKRLKWFVPVTKPINFCNNNNIKINPYLLGVILGDGCITIKTPRIYSNDDFIIDKCKKLLPDGMTIHNIKGKFGYSICNEKKSWKRGNILNVILEEYGLSMKKSSTKFIPKDYLFSSINERLSILQGLLDTDGYITKKGSVTYTTVSTKLRDGVIFIVRSLGGKSCYTEKIPKYTYKNNKKEGQRAYTVSITLPENMTPFSLPRKNIIYNSTKRYPPSKAIKNVVYVGKEEARCIQIESDDHMYITDDFIVTHNTFLSLASAFNLVFQKKLYEKIIVIKSNIDIGKDIGFLPGAVSEKMEPYFKPVRDLIFKLYKNRPNRKIYTENKEINSEFIEFWPLNFLRGQNLEGCVIIIDEIQNIDLHELKTILSRMGQNVKCICCGDVSQIDHQYLNKYNNGLNWLTKLFKNEPLYGHIVLKGKGIRGPICDLINSKEI